MILSARVLKIKTRGATKFQSRNSNVLKTGPFPVVNGNWRCACTTL